MDCHIAADERIDFRPKKRNNKVGLKLSVNFSQYRRSTAYEAFMSPSTNGAASPGGLMAGANAMKTLTFSLSPGWMLSAAKAWAVPWLNPI